MSNKTRLLAISAFALILLFSLLEINSRIEFERLQRQIDANKDVMQFLADQTTYLLNRYSSLSYYLEGLDGENKATREEIAEVRKILRGMAANMTILHHKLSMLSFDGAAYTTFNDVVRFLDIDGTNQNRYTEKGYDCCFFARDLVHSSMERGIKPHLIILYFDYDDAGHCMVGYNTTDSGFMFVDATDDRIFFSLEIGDTYFMDKGYEITRMLIF